MIQVKFINNVHMRVRCDEAVAYDLSEFFAFYVPGYKFQPKFKAKLWDGKIRLFQPRKMVLYIGLLDLLVKYARNNDIDINIDKSVLNLFVSKDECLEDFISDMKVYSNGDPITMYDHQYDAIIAGLKMKRMTLLSPTSSGKSLCIYAWCQYYLQKTNDKILIIVPTTSLVEQMSSDFDDYFNGDFQGPNIHKIYSGKDKVSDKRIFITTWQSIFRLGHEWFEQFKVCINDEVHAAKAKSLTGILEKLVDCPVKIGTTGTLDGTIISSLVIQGLFGPIKNFVTTKDLMDKGVVAKLKINNLIFKYPEEECKANKKMKYQDEIKYIVHHEARNKMIGMLCKAQTENCLILVNNIDHLKNLNTIIRKLIGAKRNIYLVYGSVKVAERERIRDIVETDRAAVIIATYGVFSTGVSIKNIHSVIFGSPTKSQIRTLQSIGRGLRVSSSKKKVVLYDIIDDMAWKKHKNFGLKHFVERMKMYSKEKFDYSINKIML